MLNSYYQNNSPNRNKQYNHGSIYTQGKEQTRYSRDELRRIAQKKVKKLQTRSDNQHQRRTVAEKKQKSMRLANFYDDQSQKQKDFDQYQVSPKLPCRQKNHQTEQNQSLRDRHSRSKLSNFASSDQKSKQKHSRKSKQPNHHNQSKQPRQLKLSRQRKVRSRTKRMVKNMMQNSSSYKNVPIQQTGNEDNDIDNKQIKKPKQAGIYNQNNEDDSQRKLLLPHQQQQALQEQECSSMKSMDYRQYHKSTGMISSYQYPRIQNEYGMEANRMINKTEGSGGFISPQRSTSRKKQKSSTLKFTKQSSLSKNSSLSRQYIPSKKHIPLDNISNENENTNNVQSSSISSSNSSLYNQSKGQSKSKKSLYTSRQNETTTTNGLFIVHNHQEGSSSKRRRTSQKSSSKSSSNKYIPKQSRLTIRKKPIKMAESVNMDRSLERSSEKIQVMAKSAEQNRNSSVDSHYRKKVNDQQKSSRCSFEQEGSRIQEYFNSNNNQKQKKSKSKSSQLQQQQPPLIKPQSQPRQSQALPPQPPKIYHKRNKYLGGQSTSSKPSSYQKSIAGCQSSQSTADPLVRRGKHLFTQYGMPSQEYSNKRGYGQGQLSSQQTEKASQASREISKQMLISKKQTQKLISRARQKNRKIIGRLKEKRSAQRMSLMMRNSLASKNFNDTLKQGGGLRASMMSSSKVGGFFSNQFQSNGQQSPAALSRLSSASIYNPGNTVGGDDYDNFLSLSSHINSASVINFNDEIKEKIQLHIQTLTIIADYAQSFDDIYQDCDEWEQLIFLLYKKYYIERTKIYQLLKNGFIKLQHVSQNTQDQPISTPFVFPFSDLNDAELGVFRQSKQAVFIQLDLQTDNQTVKTAMRQLYNQCIEKTSENPHINMYEIDDFAQDIVQDLNEEINMLMESCGKSAKIKRRINQAIQVGLMVAHIEGYYFEDIEQIIMGDVDEKAFFQEYYPKFMEIFNDDQGAR